MEYLCLWLAPAHLRNQESGMVSHESGPQTPHWGRRSVNRHDHVEVPTYTALRVAPSTIINPSTNALDHRFKEKRTAVCYVDLLGKASAGAFVVLPCDRTLVPGGETTTVSPKASRSTPDCGA